MADAPAALPPHPHRGLLSIAIMMATIMIILDKTIVNVALPHMMGSFGATTDQITWVLTSYIVAEAVIIPMSGYLAMRFGRKRLMLVSVAGFVITSFLCSQATSLTEMVIFRLLQGAFGASVIPLSQSVMVDAFDAKARGRAMAIWGMGVMVAPVAGPTLGGYLTSAFDWRAVFLINIPFGIATLLMLAALMRETARRVSPVDILGALVLAIGVGAMQIMLDQGNRQDWFTSHMISALAFTAVAGMAFFAWRSLRRADAVLDIALLRDRNLLTACVMMLVFGLGVFGTLTTLPIFLETLMAYPSVEAGLVMAPQGIASFVLLAAFARLGHLIPPRWVILAGLVLATLGAFQLSTLTLSVGPENIMWGLLLLGGGTGLVFVSSSTMAYQTLPPERTSEGAAIYNFARTVGQSVGISLATTLQVRHAQVAWNDLGGHINPYNPNLGTWLDSAGRTLSDPVTPALLTQTLQAQANLLSFNYTFQAIAISFIVLMPLVFVIRRADPVPSPATA